LKALRSSDPSESQIALINGLKYTVQRLEEEGFAVNVYASNGKNGSNIKNFLRYDICDHYWMSRYEANQPTHHISGPIFVPELNVDPQIVQYTQHGEIDGYKGYLDFDYTYENLLRTVLDFKHNNQNNENKNEQGGHTRN
jgi:hypothetical protein